MTKKAPGTPIPDDPQDRWYKAAGILIALYPDETTVYRAVRAIRAAEEYMTYRLNFLQGFKGYTPKAKGKGLKGKRCR